MSNTPFPLGAYLNAPDPGDAGDQAEFQTNYNSFTSLMGTAPAFLDYYTDFTQPISAWVSNASWEAWSAAQTPGAAGATPVITLPMSSIASGALSPDQQFQAISSGQDDGTITGIVDAWAAQGFKSLVFRPGEEMNIPGASYAGDSAQDQADWVAAFQHIYTDLHQAAAAVGVNMTVVWNPSVTNYSNAEATTSLYPGNNYVDAIGADVYADMFPYTNTAGGSDYQDWDTGGTDSSVAQFIADPVNREHYWTYPAATKWSLDSSGGHSLSLDNLIQFAEQQGKPLAIPETGAGASSSATDVNDDPTFAQWLASQLTTAEASGLSVDFVNLWDANAGSNYEFSNTSDNKPQEAGAWAQYFGAQTSTTAASVSASTTASAATSTTASTTVSNGSSTASANDTVVLAGSSAAITDTSGNSWGITSGGQVAVNGVTDASTSGVTELAYVNGTIWQENTNNLWWGTTTANSGWAPSGGTTSPLPAPINLGSGSGSSTVSQSQVSVVATSGTQMLFLSGSVDTVTLSGGNDNVTDTGSSNTYILPAAGNGSISFTSNILTNGDTLDLQTALAATSWNGAAATLSNYLTVSDTTQGATLSVAPTSGGTGVVIATISGATNAALSDVLAHAFT